MQVEKIVFSAPGEVALEKAPFDQALQPGEVLIETVCSLVSAGTELAALYGTHSKSQAEHPPAWLTYPSVPGYLVCGKIAALGPMLEPESAESKLEIGRPVVAEGPGVWNSHCSHLIMRADDPKLVPIADGVSFEQAVFTKLGSIAMTAPRVLRPEFGDTVVVLGLGQVGQLAARLAVLAGAGRVIAVDPVESRRAIAAAGTGITAVGPDDPLLSPAAKPGDRLAGFDHIIEASGHPDAFLQACQIARVRGRIAVLSSPHKTFPLRLYDHIHSKGLQILGAHGSVLPATPGVSDRWTDGDQRRFFMRLLVEQRIDVLPLLTQRVPYTRAPEMYRRLQEDPAAYLGVLFIWNDGLG